jgi:sugar phosphate isomerase/epimerase
MKIFSDNYKNRFLLISVVIIFVMGTVTIKAQESKHTKALSHIKLALNAYSFNDMLSGHNQKDNKPTLDLFQMLDWCATQNIEAVDLTGYYFEGYPNIPSDEYIYALKMKAFKLGIDISGTGIRNNFASPDPAVRAAGVELAKKYIIVAEKLGAPVLRLFAGEIPKGYENKWDEVAGWMIDCYKECAAFGEKHGVIIGIQNHGDMIQTAEQHIKIWKAVNSKWAGLILDTGNYRVSDPYVDIASVIPYTCNWQLKESVYEIGNPIKTDCARLMKIVKNSGYRGYLPIETLAIKGIPYNPFVEVPALMAKLRAAKAAEF